MNIRGTCPCKDKEADGEDDGSDTAYLESCFWGDGLSGWGFGSGLFVVVVLEWSEGYAED
jgi:hypothetical protein